MNQSDLAYQAAAEWKARALAAESEEARLRDLLSDIIEADKEMGRDWGILVRAAIKKARRALVDES
jgi:hypothetical protein